MVPYINLGTMGETALSEHQAGNRVGPRANANTVKRKFSATAGN